MSANHLRLRQVAGHLALNQASAQRDLVHYAVSDGVAVLTMNSPPVNSFSPLMAASLDAAMKKALSDSGVKGIVITGSGKFFMAGADIPHLMKMIDQKASSNAVRKFIQAGHDLMETIERGAKPTVAAVNGPALGGGLELAMSCNARVGTKTSIYGLPELKLGIIPGMGGTQRLPRLIGMSAAVKATLSGKPFPAKKALKLGLIDQLAKKPKELINIASKIALGMASGQVERRCSLDLKHRIGSRGAGEAAIEMARIKAKRKSKGVPHPFAFLDAAKVGLFKGSEAGIKEEIDQFVSLISSFSAKSLIHMFLSSKLSPKVPGLEGIKPSKIKTVAVLGGGTMGAGIVALMLFKGYNVILKEINEKVLYIGVQRVVKTINSVLKRMKLPSMALEMGMRNLTPTTNYDDFKKCDLVIEAIVENIKIKQSVFADLEKYCRKDCILATNTSTINIDVIGEKTKAQDRIVGLHFFSPAHVMPLLEIIRTKSTSGPVLASCIAYSKKIGKIPVTVGNCVGFTANRIFFPYGQAAAFLVDHGVSPYRIDKALTRIVQMPMGVHQMGDLSGLDIMAHVTGIIKAAYGERCYISSLGQHMVKAKRFGQKTGIGFYKYKGRQRIEDEKGLAPLLQRARAGKTPITDISDKDIVEMVMYPIVNESCRVLAEGHVIRDSDIDVVSITGYGFPAHKGGIMFWAKNQGLKHVHSRLQWFSEQYPQARAFFKPCAYLRKLAA